MEDDLLGQAQAVLGGSTPKGDLLSEAMGILDKKPDPKFMDQERRMVEARQWAVKTGGGDAPIDKVMRGVGSVASRIGINAFNEPNKQGPLGLRPRDLSLPFQNAITSIGRGITGQDNPAELQKKAQEAFDRGEATDEQLARLAIGEYEQNRDKQLGLGASIAKGAAQAAPMLGEALVGGQAVKGAIGAAGYGAKLAPAATATGRALQSAGLQAAATPLTPSLWLDESQQRAAQNGGNWYDPKNVAAPMLRAAFQNAIMGHLGEATKGLNRVAPTGAGVIRRGLTEAANLAKRGLAGGVLMPIEQAGADALTTLGEKAWKAAGMDEKWTTDTDWGTVKRLASSETRNEGIKELAIQSMVGTLFSAFHGGKSDPVKKMPEAIESLKKEGVSQDLAERVVVEATNRPPETIKNPEVKAYVESIIDLVAAEPPKTRSAGPSPEPAQSAAEAQKSAPAKPQTAREAIARLEDPFGEYTPKGPKVEYRPPAASERMVNEVDAPTTPVVTPKKKGLGKKELVLPKKDIGKQPDNLVAELARKQEEAMKADSLRGNAELDDFFTKPSEDAAKRSIVTQADADKALSDAMGMEMAPPIKGKETYTPPEPAKPVEEPAFQRKADFYEKHPYQHTILGGDQDAIHAAVQKEGFKRGIGPNATLITQGPARDVMEAKYGTKAGKRIYVIPENAIVETRNGKQVKEGFKPTISVVPEYDGEPVHRALVRESIAAGKIVPPEVLADYPDLAKPVEPIEEVERRETYGEPPGGVERRRFGLKFEGSEPLTEGATPAEKHAIDKYGKEGLYRVKVNDAEGKEVADAIIKEEGDTLIVPWLGKKGASSGEGKGKDIFGAREITALGKQLAEAYPDMNILKYQVGNARNAAGEQRIIDLNKYRARQAKKAEAKSQPEKPVEPPKETAKQIDIDKPEDLRKAISEGVRGLKNYFGNEPDFASRSEGASNKFFFSDVYDAIKDRLPKGMTFEKFKEHLVNNRDQFDVSRIDLVQGLDRKKIDQNEIGIGRSQWHLLNIPNVETPRTKPTVDPGEKYWGKKQETANAQPEPSPAQEGARSEEDRAAARSGSAEGARRGLGRRPTTESPRPEPVVDRVPEPVKDDLPDIKDTLDGLADDLNSIKRQGQRLTIHQQYQQAQEAAQKAAEKVNGIKNRLRTVGSRQPEKRNLNKELKAAESELRTAEGFEYSAERLENTARLEERALDASQPEFIRLAAAQASGVGRLSHDSVFKDIQKHVEAHLKTQGIDPTAAEEVTSRIMSYPLRDIEQSIGDGLAQVKTKAVKAEAEKFAESLDIPNKREMQREIDRLYTDEDLAGFKKQWGDVATKEAQARIEAERKEREAKQLSDEADAVIEKASKGLPVGEVTPQVMKEVVGKLQMQDFEWRDTVFMPKGTKGKKLIDQLAKEMAGSRWTLPKTVTEHGWWTDTNHAILATPEMVEHAKKMGHDKLEGRSPPMKDILPKKKSDTVEAKIVGSKVLEKDGDAGRILVKFGKDSHAIFDADYIANVYETYPNAELRMVPGKDGNGYQKPAVFYEGDKAVGLVMPLGGEAEAPAVSKKPAVDLGQALEKGKFTEKDAVDTGRGVAVGIDADRAELTTMGNRIKGGDGKTEYGDREYKTKAQVNKAAKKLLEYSHGSDDDGNPVFIPKGGKLKAQPDPEGFGQPLTPEEKNLGMIRGGSPAGDGLPPMDGGLKELALANENVDAERRRLGLPPLMQSARKTFGEAWDRAMVTLGKDPNASAALVNELSKKMRNLSVEESALLLHRHIQFNNAYERAIRQANAVAFEAHKTKNYDEFNRLSVRVDELLDQIKKIGDITKATGSEAGRTLAFRRQLAAEDYTLGKMMGDMTMAKKAPLTADEMKKVQDQHDRIAALEARLRDFEAKEAAEADVIDLQPAEQPGMIQRVKDWLGGIFKPKAGLGAKKSKTWDFADRMEQEAAKELMSKYGPGKLFSGFDPTGIPALAKYTAAKIIKTGLTFADFSSQIVARFGDAVRPHLKDIWDGAQKHVEIAKLDKTDVQVDLKKTKSEYAEMVDTFKRKNQPLWRKGLTAAAEANNLVRLFQTIHDISGIGRQGGPLSLGYPTKVLAAVKEMVASMKSERGYERAQMDILNRKNAREYETSGLEFTDHNAPLSGQEESIMGRFTAKTPGAAISARAFNGYLNRLRADVFDAEAANASPSGPERAAELKAIANYINAMTGRGKTGHQGTDKIVSHLGQVFYAPRHFVSRFQVISGQPFWGAGTWKSKKQVAKMYVRSLVGIGAVYGLAKLALGDEVEIEYDPRSSDFGKMKIGRTRIDPLAGLSQAIVLAARTLWGESKSTEDGKVKALRGPKHKFTDDSTVDTIARFLRYKLSPAGGEISDYLEPKYTPPGVGPLTDLTGRKKDTVGWGIRQVDKLLPLVASDIYDAFKEHGYKRASVLSLLSMLGWGSQVHEKQKK